MKKHLLTFIFIIAALWANAIDHKGVTINNTAAEVYFPLITAGAPTAIVTDPSDLKGISIAAGNLAADFGRVCGTDARILTKSDALPRRVIIAGSIESELIKMLPADLSELKGKCEMYLITTVESPLPGVDEALVVAGSDRRGAIYGIYELSEQIGVSPWYFWADVPAVQATDIAMKKGRYTAGEPAVRYRGLFLNDEAPCLTSWVKNHYGTDYGDHNFYGDVCELILRLRGNFLWPAMWCWAFYADDPLNSKTADEMGVVMGTSHHEPMARNHQEYARDRGKYGAWNYNTNQKVLDKFFRDGIERMNGTEDIITLGMRGDGDEAMSADADVKLLKRIIANQRAIIKSVTGKPAKETPQVWALYKEVQDYYDAGLRAPDDVTYLLCDDNWGNLRRIPTREELKHPGGFGLYYHVDYVGAPRNTKWLNVTPPAGMWEQLTLAAESGIDRIWILNVGDLKPMEYPITLFMDMAWDPSSVTVNTISDHTRQFCAQQFGDKYADEAARILTLYSRYNGRVTPEMLNADTYSLPTGEWRERDLEYRALEADALRLYLEIPEQSRDAYRELILFPVQAMANLYHMYYSLAMNRALAAAGDPDANRWADEVEAAFRRDAELMAQYNRDIAGGKWNGMMTQKHIGYVDWHDDYADTDVMPAVTRIADKGPGGYTHTATGGMVVIEAPHYNKATQPEGTEWTIIPGLGRTLGGVSLRPYTVAPDGATLSYNIDVPDVHPDSVPVHVVVKSTLDFKNQGGLRYAVSIDGCEPVEVNFNSLLNERPENIHTHFYPTVARRVVESTVSLPLPAGTSHVVTVTPLDEGVVFEKIVIDLGGYTPQYLFGTESPYRR